MYLEFVSNKNFIACMTEEMLAQIENVAHDVQERES